jgi:hypothetical protein
MNAPRVLYHMARADFLDRVRRYSFLLTLAGALYLAYGVATEKVFISVGGGYRGVYNSAWIGILMTVCCTTFLSLVGFYVVKNSLQRDADTRVGRILAATPMPKAFYTLAKALSNFAVLACMVLVLMVAALGMQFMRPEARPISLWQLWSPFLFIALPAMFLTASLALLFETLPILRGGVGNVLYFFLWTFGLVLGDKVQMDDPSGIQLLYRSTRAALRAADPNNSEKFPFSLSIGGEHASRTFLWNGIDWTPKILLVRLLWVAAAIALALLASIFFHRFDPAKEWIRRRTQTLPPSSAPTQSEEMTPARSPVNMISASHLTPLVRTSTRLRFPQLVASELRLMLKGQPWWWYAVAAGLLIGELASPLASARQGVLLVAWIWPILLWSQMGCRESRSATGSLIFSSERALTRQLPALWTAGVAVTALTGAGVGIRLLITSDWPALAAWVSAAIFIPSLALALGVCSGTSIPFEALYTVWWYVGPAHQMPALDFIGTTSASSRPADYAVAALVLLAISYAGRRVRLGYV